MDRSRKAGEDTCAQMYANVDSEQTYENYGPESEHEDRGQRQRTGPHWSQSAEQQPQHDRLPRRSRSPSETRRSDGYSRSFKDVTPGGSASAPGPGKLVHRSTLPESVLDRDHPSLDETSTQGSPTRHVSKTIRRSRALEPHRHSLGRAPGPVTTAEKAKASTTISNLQALSSKIRGKQKQIADARGSGAAEEPFQREAEYTGGRWNEGEDRQSRDLRERLETTNRELGRARREIQDLAEELRSGQECNRELQRRLAEQEAIAGRAQAAMLSRIPQKVSAEVPDGRIAEEIASFFANDFEDLIDDWASEPGFATRVRDPEQVKRELIEDGLLRDDSGLEPHLRFDFDHQNASFILLQAVLAAKLCELYLDDPFFLCDMIPISGLDNVGGRPGNTRRKLTFIYENGFGERTDEKIQWRISTLAAMEKARPLCAEHFLLPADAFLRQHQCRLLAGSPSAAQVLELQRLFLRFATMAIKLWRQNLWLVSAYGLFAPLSRGSSRQLRGHQAEFPKFSVRSAEMQAHETLGLLSKDTRLDGNPVCLVVRPRITGEYPGCSGPGGTQRPKTVVTWSKASVWVPGSAIWAQKNRLGTEYHSENREPDEEADVNMEDLGLDLDC